MHSLLNYIEFKEEKKIMMTFKFAEGVVVSLAALYSDNYPSFPTETGENDLV